MKKVLYFAYGSNMAADRLRWRLFKGYTKVGTHRLYGYKLVFNATAPYLSQRFRCTFANIVKGEATDYVEGVLYDITPEQYKTLDQYEGLYYKYYFDLPNSELLCAYICTDVNLLETGVPDLSYLNIVIDGCLENNLTKTYNELVLYKLANYKLKKSKHSLLK